jgi:two-component SAPR family response regulator
METGMPLAGKRLLVVEDDFLIARDLSDTVAEAYGEVVSVVTEPASVVDTAEREQVDCVLLNLNLNGSMDTGTAARLTEQGVPLVLVTGYSKDALPAALRDLPLVSKPVERSKLIDKIIRTLR